MRNFFQSRPQVQPPARPAAQSARPSGAAAAIQSRAELEDGVTVSELSELEARALCAREGIECFWSARGSSTRTRP